jgi:sugar phosphate permease
MDVTVAIEIVFWCEIGGMCGSYLAGCLADWFPSAHHWIHIYALCITILFLLLLLPSPDLALTIPVQSITFLQPAYNLANTLRSYLFGDKFSFHPNSWYFRLSLFAVGFGMNAPKALLLLQATEASVQFLKPYMTLVPTGTISGLIGFLAQVGASGSGHVMGYYVEQSFHWYFYILIFGASVLLLSLVLSHMFFVLEEGLKESVKVLKEKDQ